MAAIFLNNFDDTRSFTAGSDTIFGLGGNDRLFGLAGNDFIAGGLGNDVLDGGLGFDEARYGDVGGAVRVSLSITIAQNTLAGGVDTLVNFEALAGTPFNDMLTGNNGPNALQGGAGNDILIGLGDNDQLSGHNGNDSLFGNDGNDSLFPSSFNDRVDGGNGFDTVRYDDLIGGVPVFTSGMVINLNRVDGQNLGSAGIDVILNVENVRGGAGNDTFTGNAQNNTLFGNAGNDTLIGGAGNDVLDGGAGINDTVSYAGTSAGVRVDLGRDDAQPVGGGQGSDTLIGVEHVIGSGFADVLVSDDQNNTLLGGAGDDSLRGEDGDDFLDGGAGIDEMVGGLGADHFVVRNDGDRPSDKGLDGGSDSASQQIQIVNGAALAIATVGPAERDVVELVFVVPGNFDLQVGDGVDDLVGDDFDNELGGNDLSNVITANAGDDFVVGLGGDDTLVGGEGNDRLFGGRDADTLVGEDGNDTLESGGGVDSLVGGAGNDTYVVDNEGDVVDEATSGSVDTVVSSADFGLPDFVEVLELVGNARSGTGNDLDNIIRGNTRGNLLSGGGGHDQLYGDVGDDELHEGGSDRTTDILDGGTGRDIADFEGDSSEYDAPNLDFLDDGFIIVFRRAPNNEITETHILVRVELMSFADTPTNANAEVPTGYDGFQSEPAGRDFPSDPTTLGEVQVGGSVTGNLAFQGDQDGFLIELDAGVTYVLELRGSDTADGTLADPLLALLDRDGVKFAENDDNFGTDNSTLALTPVATDMYILSARGFRGPSGDTGTYTVETRAIVVNASVSEPLAQDFSADILTPGAIVVGPQAQQVSGDVDFVSDGDGFLVSLVAGRTYQFDLQGDGSGLGSLQDPVLELRDAQGNLLVQDSDSLGSLESRIIFQATQTAVHVLVAGDESGATGTYALTAGEFEAEKISVSESLADDFPDDILTTGVIVVGEQVTGDVDIASDRDGFLVSLEAGHTYRFDLKGVGSSSGTLTDPLLELRDGQGNLLALDDDGGIGFLESLITFTATQTATHVLVARAFSDQTGSYTLKATDLDLDVGGASVSEPLNNTDFPDDVSTTGVIVVGESVTGDVDVQDDRDGFVVSLVAGRTYRFDLEGLGSDSATLFDPVLELFDAQGNQLAFDDDGGDGLESLINGFIAEQTGAHVLVARGFADSTGNYRLSAVEVGGGGGSVSEQAGQDFVDDVTSPGSIVIGDFVTGDVAFEFDRDGFRVFLEAGVEYQFDLQGSSSGLGTLADTFLELFDEQGVQLDVNDDGGIGFLESQIVFVPEETGTFVLVASAFFDDVGTYRLTSRELVVAGDSGSEGPGQDFSDDDTTPGFVAIGDSVTGEVAVEFDRDGFRVFLQAGVEYQFDLQGLDSGLGTLDDTVLELHDTLGNQLAFDDDGGIGFLESQIVFQATQTGTHVLVAHGFFDSVGTYTLTASEISSGVGDTIVGTSGNDTLFGFAGDDTLTGLAGSDTLDGGAGSDRMIGGTANDRYIVDSFGDVVVENLGEGVDEVVSSIDITLPSNVENMTLAGDFISGSGNGSANVIVSSGDSNGLSGGGGNDTLVGGFGDDFMSGDVGSDRLTGGGGFDIFEYFDPGEGAFVAANVLRGGTIGDTIVDFQSGVDLIEIDSFGFDPFGDLGFDTLVNGTSFSTVGVGYNGTNPGANSNHAAGLATFVFSTADDTLYYDANGAGAGYTVVATLEAGAVVATDVFVF